MVLGIGELAFGVIGGHDTHDRFLASLPIAIDLDDLKLAQQPIEFGPLFVGERLQQERLDDPMSSRNKVGNARNIDVIGLPHMKSVLAGNQSRFARSQCNDVSPIDPIRSPLSLSLILLRGLWGDDLSFGIELAAGDQVRDIITVKRQQPHQKFDRLIRRVANQHAVHHQRIHRHSQIAGVLRLRQPQSRLQPFHRLAPPDSLVEVERDFYVSSNYGFGIPIPIRQHDQLFVRVHIVNLRSLVILVRRYRLLL